MRTLNRLWCADRVLDPVMLAVVGRAVTRPHALADLQRVLQLLDASASRREFVSVRAVLLRFPSGADAELETSIRHLVDTSDDLREQRGVAVLRRGDEHAETDALRLARESGEERERLEAVAIGNTDRSTEEVIADPERLDADALGLTREIS